MSDKKTNPSHYRLGKIEVIEVTEQFDFCTGNALKYLMRAGNKEGESALDDLKKARWYVERLISKESATDINDPAGIRNWGKH